MPAMISLLLTSHVGTVLLSTGLRTSAHGSMAAVAVLIVHLEIRDRDMASYPITKCAAYSITAD
jgi:hypothetical protein